MSSDIEIARNANIKPILDIGAKLNIPNDAMSPFGHYKAKLSSNWLDGQLKNKKGKLILVTAINPTPAGEGKTTTSVGLNDGLNKIGKKSIVCLREPSLGPCFGMKGGAAGGDDVRTLWRAVPLVRWCSGHDSGAEIHVGFFQVRRVLVPQRVDRSLCTRAQVRVLSAQRLPLR